MTLFSRLSASSYSLPVVISVSLHLLLVVFVIWGWQSASTTQQRVMPRYIEAKLVTLKPKAVEPKVAEKKPKVVDLVEKRKAQARRKAVEKKKRLARERSERERLRKLVEKKRQQELNKQKDKERQDRELVEAERQRQKDRRRQQEAAFADALAVEEELLLVERDEASAQGYVTVMARLIEQGWSRPPSARRGMRCELQIQLVPTGEVVRVSVIKSSGNSAFDRSAEQAVKKVGRFEVLQQVPPAIFERYFRQLTLVFDPQDLRL